MNKLRRIINKGRRIINKDKERPKLFTIKKFATKNRELGIWPSRGPILYGLQERSPQNGFGKAFVRVGGRVLIDEEKFWEAVAEGRQRPRRPNV